MLCRYMYFLIATTSLPLSINSAFTQDTDPSFDSKSKKDTIIVVGSRGRQENIIDVPISETVFTSKDIQDANIDTVDDFISLTPGVTIANAQDSGTNFITIRGMSQTRNGDPPVAVVIDGVLQVNSRSFDQALFDIESIEILRGPQGALYGRNATNGAIIINTKDPVNEFSGYGQASIGSGNEYIVEGSLSGAFIKDKLLYRASGRYSDREGYFHNVFLDKKVDGLKNLSLRSHLKWLVNENITADLRGLMVNTNGGALNYTYQPAVINCTTGLPDSFDFSIADADLVSDEFFANNLGSDKREIYRLSLSVNFNVGFADLSLVSSYDSLEQSIKGDQFPYTAASSINPAPPYPFFDGTQTQYVDTNSFSQEIRLTSKSDQRIRWMLGGYYLDTDRFISSIIGLDQEKGIISIKRDPIFSSSNPLSEFIADNNKNEAWALFFALDGDLTDQLEVSVSGRYDEDKRVQMVHPRQGSYHDGILSGPIGLPGAINKQTFSHFQPKITARYSIFKNSSLYASWGQGFRSGQFNQNGVSGAAQKAGVEGVSDVLDKEISTTSEVGFKSRFLDDRLDISGALFTTKVTNAPYFVFIGAVGAQVLVPIDKVDILGGEIELSSELSDGLDAYFSVGLSDSEIKKYNVDPDDVGNKAPYVPKYTINLGLQLRRPINESLGFFSRIDIERRGEQFWDPKNTTARSSINLINLRAGIEDSNNRWSLIASLNNASNKKYNSEWVLGGFAHAGLPRNFRVDLRVNF